eukprot:CAMPEP_0184685482 /NCGR_PEP_ID=MMETSP0312-20130426/19158_1 /TAXON_ID=31354 /ORGANISM="Compsopogon coeruleus, Strain SAG 36.94" /LENGTH=48 /DNA_ID= /DNA_START= /DNA_END= /DNA_ORIENTATION=
MILGHSPRNLVDECLETLSPFHGFIVDDVGSTPWFVVWNSPIRPGHQA